MGTIAESVPFVLGTVKRSSTDVMGTDETIIVTMEVPGVNKDDIDIEIIGDDLSVSAKRSAKPEAKDMSVYKCERNYDTFKRLIRLLPTSNQRRQNQYCAKGFSGSLSSRLL